MKRNSLSFSFLAIFLAVLGLFALKPEIASAETYVEPCQKVSGTCDCACEEGGVATEESCFESGSPARCGGTCTCEIQNTDGDVTGICEKTCLERDYSKSECADICANTPEIFVQSGELPEKKDEVQVGPFTLSTKPTQLGADILEIGYGIGALLAILFTIIGGFGVATSAGDPDKLEKAKAQITAAVSGMVFLLASALILRIIGSQIIGIDFF